MHTDSLRIVLATLGVEEFSLLHSVCEAAGHTPVAYVKSRSMRPAQDPSPDTVQSIASVTAALPSTVDLLLPADPMGLGRALSGYSPDLLVIYGFNWVLPEDVFGLPRLGTVNIHASTLPRYRGAAPVLWALRNGDPDIGVTVHRVDRGVDTGPILAQHHGIPLGEDVTFPQLRAELLPVVADVFATALGKVAAGDPGREQPVDGASRAPRLEPGYFRVDWSRPARDIHNQVRVFRFMGSTSAPQAEVEGRRIRLVRTSLTPAEGRRVECGDGPIWITEAVAVEDASD